MNIYVFTKKNAVLKTVFPKSVKFLDFATLAEHTPESGSICYMDASNLADSELKKALTMLKNICRESPWGIIDPKGAVKDPAVLFFEGACDYLGASFFKGSAAVDSKRIKEALLWRKTSADSKFLSAEENEKTAESGAAKNNFFSSGIKLPSESTFPGWNKMQSGKDMPFYLLYCSIHGNNQLDVRLDAKTLALVYKRFISCLDDNFLSGDGLLWMNSGKDCLFLVPPKAKHIEAAIKSCMNMIISTPLIVLESLAVTFPLDFVFALHYGSVSYKPPGKTGTIVSDAINFIFHLGTKKAEPGRLTISGELPDKTIPQSLQDCFLPAGEFEGRKIWHTKKFSYAKPWL
ncbi:MAG: hypothetical protein FWF68_07095 [Spirochaetes bacterium]|nr:hypothetical protein [Spirochaetota bacterium]